MAGINYKSLFAYDKSRKLYHKTITVQNADGTTMRKKFTAKDPKELYNRLHEFEHSGRTTKQFVTVEKMLDLWLEEKERECRHGTLRSYEPTCKQWQPLYAMRVDQLTTDTIQSRLQQMHDDGLSAKTIKTARSCLRMAYDWIRPQYHGALANPVKEAKLPRGMKSTKRHAPTEDETKRIIDSVNCYFGFFYFMLLYTGMRRGELLGLRWDDVGLEMKRINISHGVTFKYGKPIVGPLKTESSVRQIPILPPLLDELQKRRPDDWKGKYVFPAPTDAYSPMPESTLKRHEMHYCIEAGFVKVTEKKRTKKDGSEKVQPAYHSTITPHMMRHGTATLCYEAGVDVMTTAALLGHADTRVTQEIYTDLRQRHQQVELQKLEQYMAENYNKPSQS